MGTRRGRALDIVWVLVDRTKNVDYEAKRSRLATRHADSRTGAYSETVSPDGRRGLIKLAGGDRAFKSAIRGAAVLRVFEEAPKDDAERLALVRSWWPVDPLATGRGAGRL